MQDRFQDLAKIAQIEFHEGFSPQLYENHDKNSHLLLCLDDMMTFDIWESLANLFTRISRHQNISVVLLLQVLYVMIQLYFIL